MAPISASTNEKALAAASRSKPLGDGKGREACARALTAVGFDANAAYSSQTSRMRQANTSKSLDAVVACTSGAPAMLLLRTIRLYSPPPSIR